MKKNTAYTIGSLIILLICAFCFVILPAFTGSSDRQQEKIPPFGKYNGKEIVYEQGSDFADFVSQYGQMFQSYGQQMDQSTYYYVFNYAFNSTVTKYAYQEAVKNSGYTVPKSAVTRKLIPYFSDENGKYSSKIYKQTDASTIANLSKTVEDNLISDRFYDDNFGSTSEFVGSEALFGLKESDAELDFLTKYDSDKRGFNMAVFSMNDYPEEELVKYGKANAAKFNKFDMSAITVSEKTTANTILKRINNNEITFADAVSEYSDKTYTNTEGKMANNYQYQIENSLTNKEDFAAIANLSVAKASDVIDTLVGYTIFYKDAETVKPDFETEEVKTLISTYLKNYEISVIEDYYSAKATDFTNAVAKSDFASACEDFGIELVEIEPFPLNYGSVSIASTLDTSNAALTYADTNENFLKTAFALKKNEISKPVVINNNIVVLQYTTNGEVSDDVATLSDSTLKEFDQSSSSSSILSSDKLENNFVSVYFDYMMRS